MNPFSQLKAKIPVVLVALACFGLSPTAQAVDPPPDGGYPRNNTAEGDNALLNLTTGNNNTAVGANAVLSTTTGSANTAFGSRALARNNTGSSNVAIGDRTLFFNTTGHDLTGVGTRALLNNTTGNFNTAIGADALNSNTIGIRNTAVGWRALFRNTTGDFNVANGFQALTNNSTGIRNTATGYQALFNNTTGDDNTATGRGALGGNTIGFQNTANGFSALGSNTTGIDNTAIGFFALVNNRGGSHNIAVGFNAGTSITDGQDNIDIGNDGSFGESGTIRIGNFVVHNRTFIAGIRGETTELDNAIPVLIDLNGQLGTVSSSQRFKTEIKPMDSASEAILALKPVTFHYKSHSAGTPQFGLIAEEVAKVNPDLVVRDDKGEIYTVRYDAVNAMLLNEFLKEHKTVQDQQAAITRLQKQVEVLTAGLQKVSAAVELNKATATQVADNR